MQTKYLLIGINAAGFSALEELRKFDLESSIIAVNEAWSKSKVKENLS